MFEKLGIAAANGKYIFLGGYQQHLKRYRKPILYFQFYIGKKFFFEFSNVIGKINE